MIVYGIKSFDAPTLLKIINMKVAANVRLERLQDYYNGFMDIDKRFYDDITKPNNKIKANYCKDITDFITAYLVGVPVKFEGINENVEKMLEYNDEDSELQQLVTDMNINGVGVEMFYFDENGDIRYNNINPIESVVFMNDDLQEKITGFLRMVKNDDDIGGYSCTLLTDKTKRTFEVDDGIGQISFGDEVEHHFNEVPVILYKNNEQMQGSFEQIIPMQDALNKILSDNVNDFESFVDAYLCLEGMQGTTPEAIEEMKTNRVLLLDPDSKAYWLTKTVNHEHIKTLQDDLRATILELGNVPDMKDVKGMNVSGEAMRMRLTKTEIQASKQERVVSKGLQKKLNFLYYADGLVNSDREETETPKIVFTRNFIMNDCDSDNKEDSEPEKKEADTQ